MSFFRRTEIAIRCACRGLTLTVPDRDSLLNACEAGQRRRLQACLAKQHANAATWSVQWNKSAGDALRPDDVVAVLRGDDVIVELAYAQKGILAEAMAAQGTRVAAGTLLARLERRAKAAEPTTTALLRQFVARQRTDAELIAALRREIATLQAQRGPAARAPDRKFTRLKHEFSKRYHPDARPSGDAERLLRARVFQEFWPVVEEIERS